MANLNIPIPLKGYTAGANPEEILHEVTGEIFNIRPVDTLLRKLRLCQRPGQVKAFDEQIAGTTPIVAIASISVVDYLGAS